MKASWTSYTAAGLLIFFFLLATTAARGKSATYDESVHLYSGWRILTAGDFTTNHEHPPLMKAIAASPLLAMDVRPPEGRIAREVDQWQVSHEFVYHVNDGDRLLAAGRLPITLLATLMLWVVWRWASETLGPMAGVAALALLAFEPNILAHSGQITTDLGMTAFAVFTVGSFLVLLRRRSRGWLVGTGVLLGLALLVKFTAVLLVPVLAAIGVLAVILDGRGRWAELIRSFAIVCAIALAVLNAGYGFGGTFSDLKEFTPESERFTNYAGSWIGSVPLPVPVEYVRGFDHAEAGGQKWWNYLFGRYSDKGWHEYYLIALAVKTPLPLLVLALAAIATQPKAREVLLPAVPVVLILAAFTLSGNLKNIGLRYILPVYPFLCLIAASMVRVRPDRRWVVAALVVCQAAVGLWIYPDYLTFFNLLVGGPSHGHEVLLDSNLDWGQDLKGLGEYIRRRGIDTIYVDYFGRSCRNYYGVRSTPDFQGGLIAVSATNLMGVYSDDRTRYRFLSSRKPEAIIGGSIFVYDVPRPSDWKPSPAAGD